MKYRLICHLGSGLRMESASMTDAKRTALSISRRLRPAGCTARPEWSAPNPNDPISVVGRYEVHGHPETMVTIHRILLEEKELAL